MDRTLLGHYYSVSTPEQPSGQLVQEIMVLDASGRVLWSKVLKGVGWASFDPALRYVACLDAARRPLVMSIDSDSSARLSVKARDVRPVSGGELALIANDGRVEFVANPLAVGRPGG
jgi:hypothetical protein